MDKRVLKKLIFANTISCAIWIYVKLARPPQFNGIKFAVGSVQSVDEKSFLKRPLHVQAICANRVFAQTF